MAATFTVYGNFLSGPTYRVVLMLTLCGERFDYRHVDLAKGAHKAPEYLAINHFGQVPALLHGEAKVVQSHVILQHLAATLGKFGGRTEAEQRQAREWHAWDADRLAPGLFRSRFFARFMKPDPAVAEHYRKAGEGGLTAMDEWLASRPFLVGDQPTIADIAVVAPVAMSQEANFDLATWPNVKAWFGRMQALPGFKLPYDLVPKADAPAA